tara:strand:+ start:392 stop:718 length:327 start_codon:yes stop_codon:yes gene_type:complete
MTDELGKVNDPKAGKLKQPNSWPMVKVTWMDAMDGETGWQSLEDMLKGDLATVMDIGWMIKNDERVVIVMGSWCLDPDDKNGGRYITIPKGWVKKIEYLEANYADIRD